jgi:hypothetical protein
MRNLVGVVALALALGLLAVFLVRLRASRRP